MGTAGLGLHHIMIGCCSLLKTPFPIMPVDMAIRICLASSPPLHSILGNHDDRRYRPAAASPSCPPLRPCLSSGCCDTVSMETAAGKGTLRKSVAFADSLGLALTTVYVFSEDEDDQLAELQFHLSELEGATEALSLEDVKGMEVPIIKPELSPASWCSSGYHPSTPALQAVVPGNVGFSVTFSSLLLTPSDIRLVPELPPFLSYVMMFLSAEGGTRGSSSLTVLSPETIRDHGGGFRTKAGFSGYILMELASKANNPRSVFICVCSDRRWSPRK